jgi:restriction endonuclease S subunit
MIKKIRDIAAVQMGYAFRAKLESVEDGAVGVIQMKDLSVDNVVCDDLDRIDLFKIKEVHFAKVGDVVFRSRGLTMNAAVILDDPGIAVVSSPLLRVRVLNDKFLLPEYLCWYINQKDAQAFLNSQAGGTLQKMINKNVLEELEIVVPSIERQQQVVELARLMKREHEILENLMEKRELYMSAVLADVISEKI